MILHACAIALSAVAAAQPEAAEPRPVEVVRANTAALRDLAETDLARAFYDASADLPEIHEERVAYFDRATRRALNETDALALSDDEREPFVRHELGEQFYYNTFYGTPAAYGRAIDLAGRHGVASAEGLRVFDFGFGGIGHLRMLASDGAHCVGVEVLELLDVFYTDADTGSIANDDGPDGSVELLYGFYPGDEQLAARAGDGFDVFISKNTLKKGYIHPEREADPRFLVHLGVSDEAYMQAVHDALKPGGLMIVYNLYGTQNPEGERYLPWATGGFPFDRALCERLGFEALEWDVIDDEYAREMGARLGWGEQMDLANDLHAMYTVLRKK